MRVAAWQLDWTLGSSTKKCKKWNKWQHKCCFGPKKNKYYLLQSFSLVTSIASRLEANIARRLKAKLCFHQLLGVYFSCNAGRGLRLAAPPWHTWLWLVPPAPSPQQLWCPALSKHTRAAFHLPALEQVAAVLQGQPAGAGPSQLKACGAGPTSNEGWEADTCPATTPFPTGSYSISSFFSPNCVCAASHTLGAAENRPFTSLGLVPSPNAGSLASTAPSSSVGKKCLTDSFTHT